MVIVGQIRYELSHEQAEFPRILSPNGQNDFEGQGQWPPFSLPNDSITGCMFGANFVILAGICDASSCKQCKVYERTDGRTDEHPGGHTFGQTQATTMPIRPESPTGTTSNISDSQVHGAHMGPIWGRQIDHTTLSNSYGVNKTKHSKTIIMGHSGYKYDKVPSNGRWCKSSVHWGNLVGLAGCWHSYRRPDTAWRMTFGERTVKG